MGDLISVIMGVYNCSNTLREAIDSIVNQTFPDWEFIICDDASTDNSYEILCEYKEKYPDKFILLRNEKNSKLAYTLNRCLEHASGHFIARMDGDDISRPTRFERQLSFLKENKNIDLVGTSMQRFSEKGNADVLFAVERPDKYTLKNSIPFFHATIMAHRYVFDKLHGYTVSDATQRCEDHELWFRFFKAGFNGENIQEPLYLVREDINSIKRRTFSSRINACKITIAGFKLLGYPVHWYIRPIVMAFIKGLTPGWFMLGYRKMQKALFAQKTNVTERRN